ncbi:MAG: FKBP-type peptidyl-prolyl cis-trans isomerase [Thiohalomonadaceae bacterium]
MSTTAAIRHGARVRMHYELSFADGTGIDSTLGGEPVEFVVGDGTFAGGLEQVLLDMSAGQCERILLGPDDAFGERDPTAVHRLPRADFEHMELTEGSVLGFGLPNGDEIAGQVIALGTDFVDVDFNHPLAGRALQFYVEILAVGAPD